MIKKGKKYISPRNFNQNTESMIALNYDFSLNMWRAEIAFVWREPHGQRLSFGTAK